jgi:Bpu10I restriction endonuclease
LSEEQAVARVDELAEPSHTPHLDKLVELQRNEKLPAGDRDSVGECLARYRQWIEAMRECPLEGDERVVAMVQALNDYKRFVELELIWDSEADFLFRQRGQLKLDSSIMEEFLPHLVDPLIIPPLADTVYETGPQTTFSSAYFVTALAGGEGIDPNSPGLELRTKNQDFTVSRTAYLQASFDEDFADKLLVRKVHLAYIAAECKTNLDKTMFQEATATARDVKMAMPGSRYFLICEWLDMTPVNTRVTDIDEVLIFRGKRIASNRRKSFSSSESRKKERGWYEEFLTQCPIREQPVLRFVTHLRGLFFEQDTEETTVVERGYF